MNKCRIWLNRAVNVGPHWTPYEHPHGIEVFYEDCLGMMLPKFYWPSDGTLPVSYQIPPEAIEKVQVDEEVAARWEFLLATAEAEESADEDAPDTERSWQPCESSVQDLIGNDYEFVGEYPPDIDEALSRAGRLY